MSFKNAAIHQEAYATPPNTIKTPRATAKVLLAENKKGKINPTSMPKHTTKATTNKNLVLLIYKNALMIRNNRIPTERTPLL